MLVLLDLQDLINLHLFKHCKRPKLCRTCYFEDFKGFYLDKE